MKHKQTDTRGNFCSSLSKKQQPQNPKQNSLGSNLEWRENLFFSNCLLGNYSKDVASERLQSKITGVSWTGF